MELLTEKDLVLRLNVSYWTIRRWRLSCGLPYIKEGRILYRPEAVQKWIEEKEKRNSHQVEHACHGIRRII